jgi:ribosomal protein S18 acetylase RimI-like enzyme
MTREWSVRRLGVDDTPALVLLRREALEVDPLAFASSLEDDRALSLDFVRAALADDQEQAVFGLFLGTDGTDLAGMVGLIRESKVKLRHKATIWGVYVAPRGRSKGSGRALLEAAIEQAQHWPGLVQVQLSVSDTAVHARRLYETMGFRPWGREPRAFRWEGRFIDDHYLALDLDQPRSG